jgi:hypothetical protein
MKHVLGKLEQPSRILSCGMIKIEALFRNAGLLECVILWRPRSWPDVREVRDAFISIISSLNHSTDAPPVQPTSHRFALSNGSTAPRFGGDWAPSTPARPRERLDGMSIKEWSVLPQTSLEHIPS